MNSNELSEIAAPRITTERLLAGYYRVSAQQAYGNVKHERDPITYRRTGKWVADIHKSTTGDLLRYAGIWNTKKEAIEEVEHILSREYNYYS